MTGESMPERKSVSTRDRTHNYQVMSPTCSPLSHPGGLRISDNGNIFSFSNNVFKALLSLGYGNSALFSKGFNPFPNKSWFLHVCYTNILKTLQEKEKFLVMSNFCFSHIIFILFRELSAFLNKFDYISKLFQFVIWEMVKHLSGLCHKLGSFLILYLMTKF